MNVLKGKKRLEKYGKDEMVLLKLLPRKINLLKSATKNQNRIKLLTS
jgi:hypothetical protein